MMNQVLEIKKIKQFQEYVIARAVKDSYSNEIKVFIYDISI